MIKLFSVYQGEIIKLLKDRVAPERYKRAEKGICISLVMDWLFDRSNSEKNFFSGKTKISEVAANISEQQKEYFAKRIDFFYDYTEFVKKNSTEQDIIKYYPDNHKECIVRTLTLPKQLYLYNFVSEKKYKYSLTYSEDLLSLKDTEKFFSDYVNLVFKNEPSTKFYGKEKIIFDFHVLTSEKKMSDHSIAFQYVRADRGNYFAVFEPNFGVAKLNNNELYNAFLRILNSCKCEFLVGRYTI